ncbi:nucleoside-diphosphate sugar epimerase/dehydratase [Noviherbaspirillum sp. CPCC 100848]|uniref:Nucleoside-diphosphate sugar epimerase/dehydratase n=1 Tax=Noviherbaspirillum album TaxID=3080276 RepID=A0ABU6J7K4_9BURK|nr:nucleoside-diphosphate sugar epimerase/dehydratase [Noviherbaspirillum sp. CPCC 100848]MEC4719418.1 nucleoside-diphosphate sugar epimerase/dehydratase [Noviherbaspirillum sp. CPCC 100848]
MNYKLPSTHLLRRELLSLRRTAKVITMLGADILALPCCFQLAMLLRVGPTDFLLGGWTTSTVIALASMLAFRIAGLYDAVIRFIDFRLLVGAGMGLGAVILAFYAAAAYFSYHGIPHTALVIYWFIALSYVALSRMSARLLLCEGGALQPKDSSCTVAIYGAGTAGVKLALAMRRSGKYRPLCFFDDMAGLDRRNVAGLTVFHSSRIAEVVDRRGIDMVVIAIPSATSDQRRDILYRTRQCNVPVKTLYSMLELADVGITTHSIRDVKIEDLLGRPPIRPQPDLFAKCVRGQNVLVTGAGGSIGSELCRQIMSVGPSELHMLDHSEYALYAIEQELAGRYPGKLIRCHLGTVCDSDVVERILRDNAIDTIYHAAAYKHVPLVESNVAEGVRANVLGAQVVADAASRFHVKTCVLISTDKAVRPTSIMGASKRIAELIFQAAAMRSGSRTTYCMVRFGNVLGSSGSVIPLFKKQIAQGGPITITHPDVVRYFMSIPEAAQLVMQAGAMATGGDVFVMDMGEQVRIADLARTLIAMCGLSEKSPSNPDGDIEIRFVGLRPGEKLYEELFAGNDAVPSRHPRIMTTSEYTVEPEQLRQQLAYLLLACSSNDRNMILFLVQKLVRGYTPHSMTTQARDKTADAEVANGVTSDLSAIPLALANRQAAIYHPRKAIK